MLPYFVWKGINSTDMGVVVNSYPALFRHKERITEITVPGRPGTLTMAEGDDVYDSVIRALPCYVRTRAHADAAIGWLRGAGTVIFGNEPDRAYRARIDNQFSLDALMRGRPLRSFTVPFVCQPFRYLYPAATDVVITSPGAIVSNPGDVASAPLIRVEGSGDITLYVGTQAVELTGIEGGICMDCEMQDAFNLTVTELMNSAMAGEFPRLAPGNNVISWTGAVTKVIITPRWRWI